MRTSKTPGQLAYEADVAAKPFYPRSDGRLVPRDPWHKLDMIVRGTWEKNPTPRWTKPSPEADAYNRDLQLRIRDNQIGGGMKHR